MNQESQQFDFESLVGSLPDDKFAKPQLSVQQSSGFDLKSALSASFSEPLYYPPLTQSVFPGDQVGIVVQNRMPHAKEILEAVVQELGSASVELEDITVVVSVATAKQLELDPKLYELVALDAEDPPPIFPVDFGFHKIKFQVHDCNNDSGLSYLVANEEGDPVLVNRVLVDADVVLPIGFAMPGEPTNQVDCVYPEFSNTPVRERFEKGKRSFLANRQEVELANNTLGSFCSLQIVFGPGNVIQNVAFGARKDAVDSALESTNALWAFEFDVDADVVVATIEDHVQDQTWDSVVAAAVTASRLSSSQGPIVIWSELNSNPDRETRKACLSQFEENDISKLSETLQVFAGLLRERPVFLRSQLKRSTVEELGVGFIKETDEVVRISQPHDTGLLVRDAHKCRVKQRDIQAIDE